MSRLVCLDMEVGRRVYLKQRDSQGAREFKVVRYSRMQSRIALEAQDDSKSLLSMTMCEFAALVVTGAVELVDDLLDEPDPAKRPSRSISDISGLTIHRVIDWQVKICLMKLLMPVRGSAPDSLRFSSAYEAATAWVAHAYEAMGVTGVPVPSRWTIYRDFLKWRAARFSLAAIQRKGLEYCPWETRPSPFPQAGERARQLKVQRGISGAAIHKVVNAELAARSATNSTEAASEEE